MVSGVDEVERASRDLREAAEALDAALPGEGSARSRALVEAAGRLVALDRADVVAAWASARPDRGRAAAEASVDEGAFGAIEDAAIALRSLIDRRALGAGDVSVDELARGAQEAFALRDRIELGALGVAAILGRARASRADEESALLVFEELIRPVIFRLTELNEVRREALSGIAPARRASFWWWHEGADVAPHAAASLPAVAHLVARFPAAAEALASLVAAQRAWDEAGSARRASTKVVSLRAFVAARTRAARAARSTGIALAAATIDEEVTLVDDPGYQVSLSPPASFVVDLVADRAPGQAPSLQLDDGTSIAAVPVEGAVERFVVAIDGDMMDHRRVVLVLPLAQGTIEIPLPPEEP